MRYLSPTLVGFGLSAGVFIIYLVVLRDTPLELALISIMIMFLVLCIARPVIGILGVLAFAFVNPSLLPSIGEFGEFSLRYMDLALSFAALSIFSKMCLTRQGWKVSRNAISVFRAILLFVAYIGTSLLWVWYLTPSALVSSTASFARLIVVVLIGLLIYGTITNQRELMWLKRGLVLFMVTSVLIGIPEVFWETRPGRVGGILGVNTYGLVSGLLLLYGFAGCRCAKLSGRVLFVVLGLTGLMLSKSVSSILGTFGALFFLAIRGLNPAGGRLAAPRVAVTLVVGVALVAIAGGLIWLLRGRDVEGIIRMSGGSLAQRYMIFRAGLEIFFQHPLFGVGWQASTTEYYIGSWELNRKLMAIFGGLPEDHFFVDDPTSLHNMYIQMLAELGIIGFGLLLWVMVKVGSLSSQVLSLARQCGGVESLARFCVAALICLLIWWNTNPLYGGQTETILAVTFVALICKILDLSCPPETNWLRREL